MINWPLLHNKLPSSHLLQTDPAKKGTTRHGKAHATIESYTQKEEVMFLDILERVVLSFGRFWDMLVLHTIHVPNEMCSKIAFKTILVFQS